MFAITAHTPRPCPATPALRRFPALLAASLLLAANLSATTVNPPEFPELVNQSDYIVRAVVTSVSSDYASPGSRKIVSQVALEVKEVIAGKPPSPLVLRVVGGRVGDREMAIAGVPKFVVGEESILFVQGNGRQIYPLVRMAHGRYPILREAGSGREHMIRSDGAALRNVSEVSRPIHIVGKKPVQVDAAAAQAAVQALTPEDFIRQIRANVTAPHLREK
jgi:hypothetical protein